VRLRIGAVGGQSTLSLGASVTILVATTLAGCRGVADSKDVASEFSVAPDVAASTLRRFPDTPSVRLRRSFRLGALDGSPDQTFGFITDVGLDPGGNLYVVDAHLQRISVFDTEGRFVEEWGRAGAGPGEFVEPYSIAVLDSTVAVFDARTKRVELFSVHGRFERQITVGPVAEANLSRGPEGVIAMSLSMAVSDTAALVGLDPDSLGIRVFLHAPPITAQLYGPYFSEPGASCGTARGDLLYANPWTYEIVRIDWLSSPSIRRYVRRSSILTAVDPPTTAVGPSVQRGAVLGLGCDSRYLILASMDPSDGRFAYDLYSSRFKPLARFAFRLEDDSTGLTIPGFVGDLRDGRLATYRDTPNPQVFVYRIESR